MNTIDRDPDYLNFVEMLLSKSEVPILLTAVDIHVSFNVIISVNWTFY